MSSPRIIALPVDDRPVTGLQVAWLTEAAGWQLVLPPKAMLGHFRTPADCNALADWLTHEVTHAHGVVLSLDMLCYGGLVPSRFSDLDAVTLRARLAILRTLKDAHPTLQVYAFAATMRISNNNIADEEKAYWAAHGEAIWRWSYLTDRAEITGVGAAQAQAAEAAVPEAIRQDYLATRKRNFDLMQDMLELVEDEVIDRLILPQDDTAEYGFNIAERRWLERELGARQLGQRALIYPGADEVMHTLVAHMVATARGGPRLSAQLWVGDPTHIRHLHARYEDRPILDSIASQAHAVGIALTDHNADFLLAVHTQGRAQGDWAMQLALPHAPGISSVWLDAISGALAADTPVVVLDLAYANGSDPQLIAALSERGLLDKLAAYAGWNTASNSIGSALAQVVLAWGALHSKINRRNLALRLLEDHVYQTLVRQTVRIGYGLPQQSPAPADFEKDLAALIEAIFTPHANLFAKAAGLGVSVETVWLPWGRSFEIGMTLHDAPIGLRDD